MVADNFSPHKHPKVTSWAAKNNVELVFLPTYSSWLNWIEPEFAALRYFAFNGTGPAAAMHSAVHGVAASGVRGAGRRLPHADRVQQALGRHRIDAVRAYTDAAARAASRDLGVEAYTVGSKIAFASANPDLHTVAHEAAHVIQQRAGAQQGNDPGKSS